MLKFVILTFFSLSLISALFPLPSCGLFKHSLKFYFDLSTVLGCFVFFFFPTDTTDWGVVTG